MPNGGDNLLRVGGPDEWLCGFAIVLAEIAADGILQVGNGFEDAPPDAPTGDDRKEAFHSIEP